MYSHFIITRFNLRFTERFPEYRYDYYGQWNESWLARRFALFETFCLPSICGQCNPDFTWLVLFDEDSGRRHGKRIDFYRAVCPRFYPCFLPPGTQSAMVRFLQETIGALIRDKNPERVVTSRIDNDDAFHTNVVDVIQALAGHYTQPDYFINLEYGFQYDVNLHRTWSVRYFRNHFLSRVEPSAGFSTVIDQNHTEVGRTGVPLLSCGNPDEPLWIETIHGRNISNQLRRDARSFPAPLPGERFSLTDF